ncbi:glutathione S-transferase family protein [Aliihoeflea sp. PC F10.4]
MTILLYDLVGEDPSRPFSPHCWKVAFALAHKGLDFQSVPTPFTAVAGVEGGRHGTVPVIRDGAETVGDSFQIALYLDKAYPDRPTLFAGAGGEAMARFVERWSQTVVHGYLGAAALMDIYDVLAPEDQTFFRKSREARFGKKLEDIPVGRDAGLDGFSKSLEPLRSTLSYQPFIGGQTPLFCDYIVASAFQWVRITSPFAFLTREDPVHEWFERCLDLHDGLGRKVSMAQADASSQEQAGPL